VFNDAKNTTKIYASQNTSTS